MATKKTVEDVEVKPPKPEIFPKIGPPREIESNMRRQIRRGNTNG